MYKKVFIRYIILIILDVGRKKLMSIVSNKYWINVDIRIA